MHRHIPNFVTILNLLAGIIGIWFVLESNPFIGALFILIAALFDFLDGFLSRLLNAFSKIGKSLDSLADVVSFGVLPGIIIFKLQSIALGTGANFEWGNNICATEKIFLILPLIIPALSAIRLARFDNDDRQTTEFRGLPTPANALFIAAWMASYPVLNQKLEWLYDPWIIAIVSTFLAILMIMDFPMFSMKFKSFQFKPNLVRYIFIGISILLIALFRIPGILIIIILYILISMGVNINKKLAGGTYGK